MSKSQSVDGPEIEVMPSQVGEIRDAEKQVQHDAVFGNIINDGPNYRNVRISHMFPSVGADLF